MATDSKLKLAKDSTNMLYSKLTRGSEPTADENAIYGDTCLACKKDFTFTSKDIVDRVVRCPYCGHELVFFKNNYC